ncbi:hypothetical protein B0T18DRAFT_251959 [Schizothecium vesticola]|uniref:Uncharacterized protein n=1 Tax=Schizothecium vesticola TaxID=314040 RepID=A0AA40EEP7_9PEZI|nr:hypothetical protein B0T18DRAFT_251959 [Schizothecium vesticola]
MDPFVFSLSTAAAVALTSARHGTTTLQTLRQRPSPPPDSIRRGRDGVQSWLHRPDREPVPPPQGQEGETVRRPGKRWDASHVTARPNDRGNDTCGAKGSGEGGKGPVSNTPSPGSGLVMGSRYMFGRSPTCPGLGCRHDPVCLLMIARPDPLSALVGSFFLLCRQVLFPSLLPPIASLLSSTLRFLVVVIPAPLSPAGNAFPPRSSAETPVPLFGDATGIPDRDIKIRNKTPSLVVNSFLPSSSVFAVRIGQTVEAPPPSIPGSYVADIWNCSVEKKG